MSAENRREKGRAMLAEVTAMESMGDVPADPYGEFANDVVFGEVWTRPGLGRRERRLISLTASAILGSDTAKAAHLGGALRSGDFTADELKEVVLHFALYASMPAGQALQQMLSEILAASGEAPAE